MVINNVAHQLYSILYVSISTESRASAKHHRKASSSPVVYLKGDASMRMDHERCIVTGLKQNRFKAALKSEWEELGLDPKEIRTRFSAVNRDLSYDVFVFLRKGRSDRDKLISSVFYASFLPRCLTC
jgi:hypothetical protein